MSVLFVVVPLALLASAAAVVAFIWAVNRGQMDDLTTPAHRMLEDDAAQDDTVDHERAEAVLPTHPGDRAARR